MSAFQTAYDDLIDRNRRAALLGTCSSLLGWDKETFMPEAGAEHRAEQLALLSGMIHDMSTAPEVGEALATCEATLGSMDPRSVEAVNVRELRRAYDKEAKLPKRLVEELARVSTRAHPAWAEARRASDFSKFRPLLEQILSLSREKADAYGHAGNRYDALLDDFEPGETTANVANVFAELRKALVPIVRRGAAVKTDTSPLKQSFPIDRQRALARRAVEAIGFDFRAGRMDDSVHPFTSGIGPGDCRLTTRYDERFFSQSLFGALHEAGHGLYDQGLDRAHFGTPMGSYVSLGIHESQSRMWENLVGRSRAFWTYFYPEAQRAFPETLRAVPLDRFWKALNAVEPSYIRVEADEATYNLHIVLRFEIEQDLVSGRLAVSDLPAAWNAKFKELLGIDVPDDRRGCLQDMHWTFGGFGYFPTYALGNLYAAQFFAKAKAEMPDLERSFEKGDFRPLLDWLRAKIHRPGMRFRAGELAREVTGRPLGIDALRAHLESKVEML